MDSLHAPCTGLKKTYDACFNHWFDEYLRLAAPSVPSTSSSTTTATASSHPSSSNTQSNLEKADLERQAKLRSKSEEYEKRCGDTWRAYRTCLETGLHEKELKSLIAEAREEFPLKLPKEVNMDQ